ncbi:hypothetical protein K8R43_02155 [archaeon]|nr:hypothetical protein [archaeon]
MAEVKKQAHFRDVPKTVILHAIESISAALIQDAKYNFGKEYGFDSELELNEKQGMVECKTHFIFYTYEFRWLVSPEEGGFLVTFIGKTPGGISDYVFSRKRKLESLMDTQWAALINFGVGYLTAKYYTKSIKSPAKTKPPRHHIEKAQGKLKQKAETEHKKTNIDS